MGDIPHLALATNEGLFICNLKSRKWQQVSENECGIVIAEGHRVSHYPKSQWGVRNSYLLHLDTMESHGYPSPELLEGSFENPVTGEKLFPLGYENYFYTTCEGSKFHVVSVYQATLGDYSVQPLYLVQFYSPTTSSASTWEKDGKPHLLSCYLPEEEGASFSSSAVDFLHTATTDRDYIFLMMEVTGREHICFKLFMFTKEKGSNASHEPRGSCWLSMGYIADSDYITFDPVLCHIGNQLLVGLDKHLYIVDILAQEKGDDTLTIKEKYTLPREVKQLVHVPSISSICIYYESPGNRVSLLPLKGLGQQGATTNEGTQEEMRQQIKVQEALDKLLVDSNPVQYVSGPSEQLSPQPFSSSLIRWEGWWGWDRRRGAGSTAFYHYEVTKEEQKMEEDEKSKYLELTIKRSERSVFGEKVAECWAREDFPHHIFPKDLLILINKFYSDSALCVPQKSIFHFPLSISPHISPINTVKIVYPYLYIKSEDREVFECDLRKAFTTGITIRKIFQYENGTGNEMVTDGIWYIMGEQKEDEKKYRLTIVNKQDSAKTRHTEISYGDLNRIVGIEEEAQAAPSLYSLYEENNGSFLLMGHIKFKVDPDGNHYDEDINLFLCPLLQKGSRTDFAKACHPLALSNIVILKVYYTFHTVIEKDASKTSCILVVFRGHYNNSYPSNYYIALWTKKAGALIERYQFASALEVKEELYFCRFCVVDDVLILADNAETGIKLSPFRINPTEGTIVSLKNYTHLRDDKNYYSIKSLRYDEREAALIITEFSHTNSISWWKVLKAAAISQEAMPQKSLW